MCGALCEAIGLSQVHEQQRREIAAIDAVLAVTNAELQQHFDLLTSLLDDCFALPSYPARDGNGNHGEGARYGSGGSSRHASERDVEGSEHGREGGWRAGSWGEGAGRGDEEEEVEEAHSAWGARVRDALGWGAQEFRADLAEAKRHWKAEAHAQRQVGGKDTPLPFQAWYLLEWETVRLWPTAPTSARLARAILTISCLCPLARRAALQAISEEMAGASAHAKSFAALGLSMVVEASPVAGETAGNSLMHKVAASLGNACIFGASGEDFGDNLDTIKPSSYIAEPEYIITPMNCWIDGSLVVKAGVRPGQELRWRMDADSLKQEPSVYTQFASRQAAVAEVNLKP